SPEIEFVLVASRWSAYVADLYRSEGDTRSLARGLQLLKGGLEEFVSEIATPDRKVVLLGEMPQLGLDPIPCVMLESIYRDGVHLWRDPNQRGRCQAMTGS